MGYYMHQHRADGLINRYTYIRARPIGYITSRDAGRHTSTRISQGARCTAHTCSAGYIMVSFWHVNKCNHQTNWIHLCGCWGQTIYPPHSQPWVAQHARHLASKSLHPPSSFLSLPLSLSLSLSCSLSLYFPPHLMVHI